MVKLAALEISSPNSHQMRSPAKMQFDFQFSRHVWYRERYFHSALNNRAVRGGWSAFLGASSASLCSIADAFQIENASRMVQHIIISLFSITRVSLSNNASLVHRLAATAGDSRTASILCRAQKKKRRSSSISQSVTRKSSSANNDDNNPRG